MLTAWLLLGASVLLVIAAGAFVAAEISFVTVDRTKVQADAEQGDATARGLLRALRSLSTQLSGAQVGITITNLAIGFLAEPAISDLISGPLESLGVPEGAVRPVAVTIGLTLSSLGESSWECSEGGGLPHRRRPRAAVPRNRAVDRTALQ